MATPEEIKLKFRNGLIPTENDFADLIDIVSDTAAIVLPSQDGASGQYLKSDGVSAHWSEVDALPSQESASGLFLKSNSGSATWAYITDVKSILDYIPREYHAAIRANTGTVDHAPYIQSAIASNRTLWFPSGRYNLYSSIIIPSLKNNIIIYGDGEVSTRIQMRVDAPAFILGSFYGTTIPANYYSVYPSYFNSIFDMSFSNSVSSTTPAIELRGTQHGRFDNLRFSGFEKDIQINPISAWNQISNIHHTAGSITTGKNVVHLNGDTDWAGNNTGNVITNIVGLDITDSIVKIDGATFGDLIINNVIGFGIGSVCKGAVHINGNGTPQRYANKISLSNIDMDGVAQSVVNIEGVITHGGMGKSIKCTAILKGGSVSKTISVSGSEWVDPTLVPTQSSSVSGRFLTTDGTSASWAVLDIPTFELTATINGYDVSGNPVLTAADVSAQPTLGYTPVNDTTTVNGKRLDTNISLSGSDLYGMEPYIAKPLVRWQVNGSPELIDLSSKGIDFLSSIIQIDPDGAILPIFNFINSENSPSKELILFNINPTDLCRVAFDYSNDWAEDSSKFITVADPSFALDAGYIYFINSLLTWCTVIPPNSILKLVQNGSGAWSIQNKSLITGATSGLIVNNDKSIGVDFTQVASTNHTHINYSVTGHNHDNEIIKPDSIQFEVPVITPTASGTLYWDAPYRTLSLQTSSNTTVQLGQENVVLCLNDTGALISNGQVVRISGAGAGQLKDRPKISLAIANAEVTSYLLGVATQDIANGQEGFVTSMGTVNDVDTRAFTTGQLLWLSATVTGGLTATRPIAPNHANMVGFALNSYNSNAGGAIFVTTSLGHELDELHDVLITSATSGQILKRNAANTLWVNGAVSASEIVGITNYATTATVDTKLPASGGTITNYNETAGARTVSGAFTIALSAGNVQDITLTGAATMTLPAATSNPAWTLTLRVNCGGFALSYAGSPTITWLTVDNVAPTLNTVNGKANVLVFESYGSKILGHFGGKEA